MKHSVKALQEILKRADNSANDGVYIFKHSDGSLNLEFKELVLGFPVEIQINLKPLED